MSVTLHKFVGEYGNYSDGHSAKVSIMGVNLRQHPATGPELQYIVSYIAPRTFAVVHIVNQEALHLMRNWLVSQPIVGAIAWTYLECEVFERIEQYYGHQGLSEFMLDYQSAARSSELALA